MMHRSATLSPDGAYRYELIRTWADDGQQCTFIMLNPSTADGTEDDPTIRRCIDFAQRTGHTSLRVVNLYAFRATDPKQLRSTYDPVGPENDRYLQDTADMTRTEGGVIIAAWGAGAHPLRVRAVTTDINWWGNLWCLGVNNDGSPKHPLYLPKSTPLQRWGVKPVAVPV